MRMSAGGLESLKDREGVVLTMYRDSAGLPTIGCGHLLTKDELRSGKIAGLGEWTDGLAAAQADELLQRDLAVAEVAVDRVRVPLTIHQRDALVSFVFNVGVGTPGTATMPGTGFLGSTLLKKLNAGDYAGVPAQLRRWIHSAGRRDPILVTRRESEITQWETT